MSILDNLISSAAFITSAAATGLYYSLLLFACAIDYYIFIPLINSITKNYNKRE